MGNKDKRGGHCTKQKLTKKELKAQNHAKLIDLRRQKTGGGNIETTMQSHDNVKKAA